MGHTVTPHSLNIDRHMNSSRLMHEAGVNISALLDSRGYSKRALASSSSPKVPVTCWVLIHGRCICSGAGGAAVASIDCTAVKADDLRGIRGDGAVRNQWGVIQSEPPELK